MDELRCIEPETVAETLELPPEHPVRRHAQQCPRCRALLDGYRLFLSPPEPGPEHDLAQVDRRLDAVRHELTLAPSLATASEPRRATSSEPSRPRSVERSQSPWWARLFQPSLRPAWALATAAVVVAFVFVLPQIRSQRPGSTLRGGAPSSTMLLEPRIAPDGSVQLSWKPSADVTQYEIVFFSTELHEIGHHDAGTATTVSLTASDLPAAYRAGDVVLYRVLGRQNGDVIATSEVGTIRPPR